MSLLPDDRARGRAEQIARSLLFRLDRLVALDAPIRPETRAALIAAAESIPSAPVKAGAK